MDAAGRLNITVSSDERLGGLPGRFGFLRSPLSGFLILSGGLCRLFRPFLSFGGLLRSLFRYLSRSLCGGLGSLRLLHRLSGPGGRFGGLRSRDSCLGGRFGGLLSLLGGG